jgi:hypothetical protein
MAGDDKPATKGQLEAIERRADLIERECPGPYTRKTAREEIKRLDARIRELRADGAIK